MKPSFKKLPATFGGIMVGAVIAMSTAVPAQAHAATIAAVTTCGDENRSIAWSVTNDGERTATVERVESTTEAPVSGELSEGALLEQNLVGHQTVPHGVDASLTITLTWSDGEQSTVTGDADIAECAEEPSRPTLDVAHTCGGLSVTVTNPEDGDRGQVVLSPSAGNIVTVALWPGASETVEFPKPGGVDAFTVEITGAVNETIVWDPPEECPAATLNVFNDCNGMTFTLANPTEGEPTEVSFTPTAGPARTVTVLPGDVVEVVFPAQGNGFTVTVSNDEYVEPFRWARPDSCATLPVTGASSITWAVTGGAAVLLGVGLLAVQRIRPSGRW
ncbi:MAG TPA: LPXTG cell wall anchor domain-containing protein [Candidatus Stackebrandtia excrementipullorum]|nr:LPXTG cell wall anchor domain-containing protein [Candidatus Stackebrandtia excrementipullorum]